MEITITAEISQNAAELQRLASFFHNRGFGLVAVLIGAAALAVVEEEVEGTKSEAPDNHFVPPTHH